MNKTELVKGLNFTKDELDAVSLLVGQAVTGANCLDRDVRRSVLTDLEAADTLPSKKAAAYYGFMLGIEIYGTGSKMQ